jgi:hypothetical protein
MYKGYVHTHEHDFVRAHGLVKTEKGKKLLVCNMCDQLFCECCGKDISISYS